MMRLTVALMLMGSVGVADPVSDMQDAAELSFASMPDVRVVDRIVGICGADRSVNKQVAYCTTTNVILLARDARDLPQTAYLLGHAFGHAVQVRHGVADVALRTIRNRPDDEAMIRSWVEAQVDCIAGVLVGRAGMVLPPLDDLYTHDPFDDVHWGRNPLRVGPQIAMALDQRAAWFAVGQEAGLGACAPGEFGAELLLQADRFEGG